MSVRLQSREKSLLSVLLLVVIVVGVWRLALDSLWNRYLQATEVVQSLSEKLEQAKVGMARRDDIAKEQSDLLAVLARVAPSEEGDPGALAVRRLVNATQNLDVHLSEIKPTTERKVGMFLSMPITVRGTGGYQAFVAFLSRLHTSMPFFEVTKVQVNAAGQERDKVDFSLSITARRFIDTEAKQ